ncbi:hypothetical protein LIER_07915 [Lithospermum erythrorhizon]|uniref:Uncharacterized protein n=1 Tax=Lithospermum erythrorhizon TaxID=34254 RepID=A0AAV3PAY3_LITER
MTPDQLQISTHVSQNRLSLAGRPDDKIDVFRLGVKGFMLHYLRRRKTRIPRRRLGCLRPELGRDICPAGEVIADLHGPVKGGLGNGKVLGAGTSSAAQHLMVEESAAIPPPPPTTDVMEELRKKCEEEEEARDKALSEELASIKESNAWL